jgi:hypothetical protein
VRGAIIRDLLQKCVEIFSWKPLSDGSNDLVSLPELVIEVQKRILAFRRTYDTQMKNLADLHQEVLRVRRYQFDYEYLSTYQE